MTEAEKAKQLVKIIICGALFLIIALIIVVIVQTAKIHEYNLRISEVAAKTQEAEIENSTVENKILFYLKEGYTLADIENLRPEEVTLLLKEKIKLKYSLLEKGLTNNSDKVFEIK